MSSILMILPFASIKATDKGINVFFIHMQTLATSQMLHIMRNAGCCRGANADKDWGAGSAYVTYSYTKSTALFGRDRDYVHNAWYVNV